MSLPFGAKAPDRVEIGHATSAPARPMLFRKAAITSIVAGILFLIVYWIIDSSFISLGKV